MDAITRRDTQLDLNAKDSKSWNQREDDVEVVLLNRGLNRFLVKEQRMKPNTRPDVAYKTTDGKIHQVEVPSKTDKPDDLLDRMKAARDRLPENMQGKHRNAYIKKDKE